MVVKSVKMARLTAVGLLAIFIGCVSARAATINVAPGGDIAAAVSSASAGDTVLLADGEYALTAQVTISKDITVRGTSRDGTIVKRSSGNIRLFDLNSVGAVLSTMTIEGGYTQPGANVQIESGGGTVTNCVLRGGYANGNGKGGSAIALWGGLLTHSIITNNDASITSYDHSGGAIYIRGSSTVDTCLVADNSGTCSFLAQVGAAGLVVDAYSCNVTIRNCTFVRNKAVGGGAIYAKTGANTTISNCLFALNRCLRSSSANNDLKGSYGGVVNCAFETLPSPGTKVNCVVGNVGFEDAARGDFRPAFDSVALSNAALSDASASMTDLNGAPRLTDGTADIGAYQHLVTDAIRGYFTAEGTGPRAVPCSVTFTAAGSVASGADITYTWDFGDDSASTTGVSVTHTYTAVGQYEPTLTLSASGETDKVVTYGKTVAGCPAELYVSPSCAGSAYPYADWDTAATNIQTTLDLAGDGSTVYLDDGEFRLPTGVAVANEMGNCALVITNGIRVISRSGNPAQTVISRSGSGKYRLVLLNHPDASLNSVSITNGYIDGVYYWGGGAFIDYDGGVISNCVVQGCQSYNNAGGGAGVGMYGGMITHSLITNNYSKINANDNHGGSLLLYGGIARNCLIANNDAKADTAKTTYNVGGVALYGYASVESCTIAGNTSFGTGGIRQYSSNATVTNCVIQNNSSSGYAADSVYQQYYASSAGKFVNCASTVEIAGGTSCFSGDLPVANASTGNWRPVFGSIAITNGVVCGWMATAKDLDGHDRIGTGNKVDIGAYQYEQAAVGGSFTMSTDGGAIPLTVVFTATAYSEVGDITSYVWDFDDGTPEVTTTEPTVTNIYTTIGTYTPSLHVIVETTSYPIASVLTVATAPNHIYVVNFINAGEAYPYTNWVMAASTLSTALDAAGKNSVIVLVRGVHTNSYNAVVEKGVTITGETSDPADAVIYRTSADSSGIYRTVMVNNVDAVVKNLTISGGCIYNSTTTFGANLWIQGFGGTVTNCIIRDGRTDGTMQNASCGSGAVIQGGLLTHCIITNNTSKLAGNDNGSGGGTLVMMGGVAEYCLVASNQVVISKDGNVNVGGVWMRGGTLRNCTIANNDGGNGIGGIRHYTGSYVVQNCLVAGNVSASSTELDKVCDSTIAAAMDHCATDVDTGNASCFSGDTFFLNAAKGDFRPLGTSVAINNALVTDDMTSARDLLGQMMVGNNGKADIGAYRHKSVPPRGTVVIVK